MSAYVSKTSWKRNMKGGNTFSIDWIYTTNVSTSVSRIINQASIPSIYRVNPLIVYVNYILDCREYIQNNIYFWIVLIQSMII